VLQTMMWPDEIRNADFASVDTADAKPAEVKMAKMLVETLAGDFEPDEYEDDYRQAVEALVTAKIEGGEIKAAPKERKTGGEVVDLLAALQRSVEAAQSARGEDADVDLGEADEKPARTATKKSAAQKATQKATQKTTKKTTKKAAAKKSTSKKTTAKKTARKAS
jgi:DNA end-binding protein Ku